MTITADTNVFARWTQAFTITYNANKPTAATTDVTGLPDPNPIQVKKDTMVVKPSTDPALTDYRFVGWYNENTGTTEHDFSIPVTEHLAVFAKWVLASGAVTAVEITSGTNAVIGTDLTLTAIVTGGTDGGVTWSIVAPTPAGVSIDATNGVLKTIFGTTQPGTVTVQAASNADNAAGEKMTVQQEITIRQQQFAIKYELNKPAGVTATVGNIPPANQMMDRGAVLQKPAPDPTLTDYRFIGWYNEAATTSQYDFTATVTAAVTLYAKWVSSTGVATAIEITSQGPATKDVGYTLMAIVTGGTDETVTWSFEGEHDGVTITDGVLLGTRVTSVTVKATSNGGTTPISQTQVININPALVITSAANGAVNQDLTLSATVDGTTPSTGLVWSIDGTAPTEVTLNGGVLSATAALKVTVVATYTIPGTAPARTTVKKQKVTFSIFATSVVINPLDANPDLGTSVTLIATVLPAGTDQTVTWAFDGTAPEGYTLNPTTGDLTSDATMVKQATVNIVATSSNGIGGGIVTSPTSSVIFNLPSVTGVMINPLPAGTIPTLGVDLQLTANVLPAGSDQSVRWTIEERTFRNIFSLGLFTGVLRANDPTTALTGEFTVKATAGNGGVTDTIKLNYVRPTVTDVTVNPISPIPKLGTRVSLEATTLPAGSEIMVTWGFAGTAPDGFTLESWELRTNPASARQLTVDVIATSSNGINGADVVSPVTTITFSPPDLTSFTIGNPSGTLALGTDLDLNLLSITTVPHTATTETLTWSIQGTSSPGYSIEAGSSTLRSVIADARDLTVEVQAAAGAGVTPVSKMITFPAPALTSFTIGNPRDHVLGGFLDLNALVTTVPVVAGTGSLTWTIPTPTRGYSIENGNIRSDARLATTLTVEVQAAAGAGVTPVSKTITYPVLALNYFTIGNPSGTLALGTDLDLNLLSITTEPPTAVTGTLEWSIPTETTGYSVSGSTLSSNAMTATGLTVTVQATTSGASPKTAMKTITFPAPALASIEIARIAGTGTGTVTVPTGGTLDLANTFTVTGSPSTAAVGTLTWRAPAETATAAGGTITGNTFTAGSIAGTVTLTVSSDAVTPAETTTIDIAIESSAPPALESFTIGNPSGHALGTPLDLSTLSITTEPATAVTGDLTWTIPTMTTGYNIASGSSSLTSVVADATTLSVTVQATTSGASPKTAMKTITFPAPPLTSFSIGNSLFNILEKDLDLSSLSITTVPPTAETGTLMWSWPPDMPPPAGYSLTGSVLSSIIDEVTTLYISIQATTTEGDNTDITITFSPPALQSITVARRDGMTTETTVSVGSTLQLNTQFIVSPVPPIATLGTETWTAPANTPTIPGGTINTVNVYTAGNTTGQVELTVYSDAGTVTEQSATINIIQQ